MSVQSWDCPGDMPSALPSPAAWRHYSESTLFSDRQRFSPLLIKLCAQLRSEINPRNSWYLPTRACHEHMLGQLKRQQLTLGISSMFPVLFFARNKRRDNSTRKALLIAYIPGLSMTKLSNGRYPNTELHGKWIFPTLSFHFILPPDVFSLHNGSSWCFSWRNRCATPAKEAGRTRRRSIPQGGCPVCSMPRE